jgi:SpoIID/LytB domain protein
MRPPRALPLRRPAGAIGAALACVLVAAPVGAISLSAVSLTVAAPAQAAVEQVTVSPSGTVKVFWRGNGHGHGMSQYGARGAAAEGLTTDQILAFYYPGTKLTRIANSTVRVRISGGTADTTVFADSGLTVSGYGETLPAAYSRFRLAPSGSGLMVQGQKGSTWKTLKRGLPASAFFSRPGSSVRLLLAGGSSTRYRGTVGAVRSGSGEITVNHVSLDRYTQGVVPREMPASWSSTAVRAQAVAARTYAKSLMEAAGRSGSYDICDTTSCQVYGGMTHYDSAGHVLWSDDPAATVGNENTILTYGGAAVFAQFSASNGGATVDGGKPYLIGKSDPYDASISGDPYLSQSETVKVASIASHFGLKSVSSVQITKRDGNGPWGGRVVSAVVNGTRSTGGTAHISTDGFGLGGAFGLGTNYLRLQAPAATTPAAPTGLHAAAGNAAAQLSWTAPASTGGSAITGYRVHWSGHTLSLPATARSTWVAPLSNIRGNAVTVSAVNARGPGTAASVTIRPAAAPSPLVPVAPERLFDTAGTLVDPTHPYTFVLPGAGSIPASGAQSVQLAVTVLKPSAAGVLTVAPSGVDEKPMATLAYGAGRDATATISVPLTPSGTAVFRPSAGTVRIVAEQQSYGAGTGSRITTGARRDVAAISNVPTGNGTAVSLAGVPGIGADTTGVLVAVDATSSRENSLRLWADGVAAPPVQHVEVQPDGSGSSTVFVPLPASHRLRIGASAPGITARLTLLGVLGASGGRFESFPTTPLIDAAAGRAAAAVGPTATDVALLGRAQLPNTGVSSVLLAVTVQATGAAGRLWAYPSQAPHAPATPSVRFAATGSTTGTTLIRVGNGSGLAVRSSVAGVRVSVDVLGYVTSA